MDDMILIFLKTYKKLDELCKQVLSSTRGISEYIDQMQSECKNSSKVPNWDNDLKELKRLRWIRNQLVHDADSFDTLNITKEDISYLNEFRSRILNCEDPFAQLRNIEKCHTHSTANSGSAFKNPNKAQDSVRPNNTEPQEMSISKILLVFIILLIFVFFFFI